MTVPIEITRERKLGAFKIGYTDIRAEASGLPLLLTRSYDSTKKDTAGDFGWGWSAASQDLSVRKNMVLGLQWQVQARGLELCIVPVGKRRVTVALPDGGVYRFQARNEAECGFGSIPPLNIVFDPLPLPVGGSAGGSAGSTAATGQLEVILTTLVEAQSGMLVDMDTGEPWNPTEFKFTSAEGFKYFLKEGVGAGAGAGAGITQVIDPYGNTLSYGAGGIQHSAGGTVTLGIELQRDAQVRITKATDPRGQSLVAALQANPQAPATKATSYGCPLRPG